MENMWHKEEEHGGAVKQDGGGESQHPFKPSITKQQMPDWSVSLGSHSGREANLLGFEKCFKMQPTIKTKHMGEAHEPRFSQQL